MKKTIIIGLIATAAIFFLVPAFTLLDRNNDWKTIDDYVLINPSVRQSVGWALENFGVIIGVLIASAVAGFAIAFASQDQMPFTWFGSSGQKGDWFTALPFVIVGMVATLVIYNGAASRYRNDTYYTVKKADFNPDAAAKGQYDKYFYDPFQPDPLRGELIKSLSR